MGRINILGKYPSMGNWVVMYKRDGGIYAYHVMLGEETQITEREARYLRALDGNRDPFNIPGFTEEECEEYFDFFNWNIMLRDRGIRLKITEDGFERLFTMFIPKHKSSDAAVYKIISQFCFYTFLPFFIFSLVMYIRSGVGYRDGFNGIGAAIGIVLGVILHEAMHAVTTLANGGYFIELGLMFKGITTGAYALVDSSPIRSRLKKAQVYLAGIEANLILAGTCFLLLAASDRSAIISAMAGGLFYAAIENVFLALSNLTLYDGLDGEGIITELLGCDESIVDRAKFTVRYALYNVGYFFEDYGSVNGCVRLCISSVILMMQLSMPLLVVCNIVFLFV